MHFRNCFSKRKLTATPLSFVLIACRLPGMVDILFTRFWLVCRLLLPGNVRSCEALGFL